MKKLEKDIRTYTYEGPVVEDGMYYHTYRWRASTLAVSEKKARANLVYRYKKEHNIFQGVGITLPGKLVVEE